MPRTTVNSSKATVSNQTVNFSHSNRSNTLRDYNKITNTKKQKKPSQVVASTMSNSTCDTSSSSLLGKFNMQSTPTVAANDVRNAVHTTASSLQTIIASSEEIDYRCLLMQVVKDFTNIIERMQLEFEKQITEFHGIINQLLNNKLSMPQATLNDNNNLDRRLDIIERQQQSNKIVIDGVPFSDVSSKPANVFNSLCRNIGIDVPPSYNDIFCVKKNASNDSGSIVVKMHNNADKRRVLKTIAAKVKAEGNLTLKHLDINSEQRIFVHENLTSRNYKIFRKALDLKRKYEFASVFTIDGRVFIKTNVSSQPMYVQFFDELAMIEEKCNTAIINDDNTTD